MAETYLGRTSRDQPAWISHRDRRSEPKKGQNDMNEYLVKTPEGDPLVILEAADLTDAELYAHRNLKGVNRVVPMPSTDAHEASLVESFTTIMGNADLGKLAAKGRDSQESGPRHIVVPRQLAGGAVVELTEAQRQRQEEISGGSLEESFRRMGFSESAAKIAARGRE